MSKKKSTVTGSMQSLFPAFPCEGALTGLTGLSKREYIALKILQTAFASEGRIPSTDAKIDRHIGKSIEIADAFVNACQSKATQPEIIEIYCGSDNLSGLVPSQEGIVARISHDNDVSKIGTWCYEFREGTGSSEPQWYQLSPDPEVWVTRQGDKIVLL